MGLGIYKNDRHQPITPYKGSWAHQEELKRKELEKIVDKPKKSIN
jgi:hypothetical protein